MDLPLRPTETFQTRREGWTFTLYLGLFLMNLLFLPMFFSSVLFIFHIPISALHLPFALAADMLVLYFFTGNSKKITLAVSVIGIMLTVAAAAMCAHTYDWSYDGNTYHKSIAGLLRYGWNPLYETYYEHGGKLFSFVTDTGLMHSVDNAMAKGTETWAACVYVISNAIESGKAFNLISMLGAFFTCLGLLGQTGKIKPWQSVLCVFLCIVNSVSVAQCFTYYVDGIMWQMITVCLAALLYFTFYGQGKYKNICGYLIFLTINVGLNIKLSGLIYFGVLGIAFFVFWFVESLLAEGNTADFRRSIGKKFALLAASAGSGVAVTGVITYVANILRYQNPLYTIIGAEENINTYQSNLPICMVGMSKIQQFFVSLFSRSNTNRGIETVEWKFPFFFDGNEFTSAQGFDTRIAGWGIFFSGLFIIGTGVIVWWLVSNHVFRRERRVAVMLLLVYLVSLNCVPGLYWARYNLAMFYIPAAGMFILFSERKEKNRDIRNFLAGVLGAALLLNMMPSVKKGVDEFEKYDDYHTQLVNLSKKMKENEIELGTVVNGHFRGRLFSLVDLGITEFNFVGELSKEEKDGTVFYPYGIDYKFVSGLYAADTMEDFLDWVSQGDYITLIAVRDEGSFALTEAMLQKAQALGLDFSLAEDGYRKSYCAVIDGKTVIQEEMSAQRLDYNTELNGHSISLTSAGFEVGKFASIQVDGVEYALNRRGLNIVLIDRETWGVVESVSIDSFQNNIVCR